MEQHPIPQHIAAYEFRLVGDMTLKQFGLLVGPFLIALLFYASHLPGYFKWPAIVFLGLLGVAMAFFPIEERPLHRWLIAFFKAVYSPTQFIWKKQLKKLAIFEAAPAKKAVPKKPVAPADKARLTQYLKTLPTEKSPLEKQEENFLQKVTNLFQVTKIPVVPVQPIPPFPPIQPPPPPPPRRIEPLPVKPIKPTPAPVKPQPTPPPAKKPFKIIIEPEKRKPAVEAKRSPELPFPQTPQTPNILVGMVLDSEGKIIENAILEIRNSKGIPVRALKTNKIGQFRIATPLKNDTYEIEIEKEGHTFDIIKLKLTEEIVEPIEIRAKSTN